MAHKYIMTYRGYDLERKTVFEHQAEMYHLSGDADVVLKYIREVNAPMTINSFASGEDSYPAFGKRIADLTLVHVEHVTSLWEMPRSQQQDIINQFSVKSTNLYP